MDNEIKLIKVKKSTRELIKSLGKKGESYDDVIKKLLKIKGVNLK